MIKQLRIQNFKSLWDVTLDLQRVNLLIGPNNCGKTNVLKALKFFSDFLVDKYPDDETIITLYFRPMRIEYFTKEPISLRLYDDKAQVFAGWMVQGGYAHRLEYGIVIAETDSPVLYDQSLIDISSLDENFDRFRAVYDWEERPLEEIFIPSDYKLKPSTRKLKGYKIWKSGSDKEYRTTIEESVVANTPVHMRDLTLWRPLYNIVIYRPDPTKLLEPYPSRSEDSVDDTASNLIAFLQEMRNKYPDVYNRILSDLQRFVPEYEAISFEYVELPEDDALRVKYGPKSYSFYKLGLIDKYKRTFWAEDLSEGILYFLALLAIVHQPNPPKILLLEEPEKGIHPRRIREVLDLIFELGEEKDIQVIMTTHSPLVVDRFSDIPESVFVLEKPENETIVKNLQRDVIEPMDAKFRAAGEEPIPYTEALGENWAMGFLGGVPHGRI